jgi:hypothetical protein
MASRCYGGKSEAAGREESDGPNNVPLPAAGIQRVHGGSYMGRVVVGCNSELLQQRDGGESWVPRRRCTFPHTVNAGVVPSRTTSRQSTR